MPDSKPIRLRTRVLRSALKSNNEPGAQATGVTAVDRAGGDYGAGLIRGVSIITAGECLGHDCIADAKTLAKLVELGNTNKNGTKVRFTHPNLSADGTGKLMARGKNFALDGDQVRADVHFLASAHNTPHGDLAGYTMDMAEESPDLVGTSVVIDFLLEKQRDADGKQQRDAAGKPLMPLLRPTRLWAFDLVDEPAANPGGLFADDSMPDAAARQASAMLDLLFGDLPPRDVLQRVDSFMNRYFSSKGIPMPQPTDLETPAADALGSPIDAAPAHDSEPRALAAGGQLNDAGLDAIADPLKAVADAASIGIADAGSVPHADDIKLAERKRCTRITAMCKLAGLDKLAAGFIANDATIDEVSEALVKQLAHKNQAVGALDSDDPINHQPDPDAKFKAEYAALEPKYRRGISEAEYVRTCRIDAGRENLVASA